MSPDSSRQHNSICEKSASMSFQPSAPHLRNSSSRYLLEVRRAAGHPASVSTKLLVAGTYGLYRQRAQATASPSKPLLNLLPPEVRLYCESAAYGFNAPAPA